MTNAVLPGLNQPLVDESRAPVPVWRNYLTTVNRLLNVGALVSGIVGYGPPNQGIGGFVSQTGNKNTTVTINKISGQIQTFNDSLAAGAAASFTVFNNKVGGQDAVVLNIAFGTSSVTAYEFGVVGVISGAFFVYIRNVSAGALADGIIFNFAVIKGVGN